MPERSMRSTTSSSMRPPAGTISSPFSGSTTSTAAVRPRMRSPSGAITSPPSTTARMVRPWVVPQSSSVMMASCATSTSRRVR